MVLAGYIIVINRNGSLGSRYPLMSTKCTFGQSHLCDVRLHLDNVARKHCVISALPNEPAFISNLSPLNTTLVNSNPIGGSKHELKHADVITVGDRHFRWEYPIKLHQTPIKNMIPNSNKKSNQKSAACMVQVPLSVLKNKRHSIATGVINEDRIVAYEGQEPSPKRRKTIHQVSDLSMEKTLTKPVNKQLLVVSQSASSPNSFKEHLKSKRKSFIPVPKTPKSDIKVISTKVRKSKSLSPSSSKSSLKKSKVSLLTNLTPRIYQKKSTPKNTKGSRNSKSPTQKNVGLDVPKRTRKSSVNLLNISSLKNRTPTPNKCEQSYKSPKSSHSKFNSKLSSTTLQVSSVIDASASSVQSSSQTHKSSSDIVFSVETTYKTDEETVCEVKSPKSKTPRHSLNNHENVSPKGVSNVVDPSKSPNTSLRENMPSKGRTLRTSRNSSVTITGIESNTPTNKITRQERSSTMAESKTSPYRSPRTSQAPSFNSTSNVSFNTSKNTLSALSLGDKEVSSIRPQSPLQIFQIAPVNKTPNSLPSKSNYENVSSRRASNRNSKVSSTPAGSTTDISVVDQSPSNETPIDFSLMDSAISKNISNYENVSSRRASNRNSKVSSTPAGRTTDISVLDQSPSNETPIDSSLMDSAISKNISNSLINEISPFNSPKSPNRQQCTSTPKTATSQDKSSLVTRSSLKHEASKGEANYSINKSQTPRKPSTLKVYHDKSASKLKRTPRGSLNNSETPKASTTQKSHNDKNNKSVEDSSHKKIETSRNVIEIRNHSPLKMVTGKSPKTSITTEIDLLSTSVKTPSSKSPLGETSTKTPSFLHKTILSDDSSSSVRILRNTGKIKTPVKTSSLKKPGRKTTPNSTSVTPARSQLSSRKSSTSMNQCITLKSNDKNTSVMNLQNSKRKYDNDAEAKAERAAKRLKMETPKSLSKNKVAALLVCHGRSPKALQKKMLYSDILKSRLSIAKQKPISTSSVARILPPKMKKQKTFKPQLDIPKSFKFNSTGHANSPETIVITKKLQSTPAPKTRKGRKSVVANFNLKTEIKEDNLHGVPELFKTPSKTIVSSLKTASSVKKPSNVRVRFSVQKEVKSPSGRRSSVKLSDQTSHNDSPIVPSKRYFGTPRPTRISESSLFHTSIIEESPLSQNTISTNANSSVSTRKSRFSGKSTKSFDFSVYSPSSPTLQFSKISNISMNDEACNSTSFGESSLVTDYTNDSPKRKKPTNSSEKSLTKITSMRRISLAGINRSSNDAHATQSRNDKLDSSLRDSATEDSKTNDATNSINTSGIFKFSPETSYHRSNSSGTSPKTQSLNLSQIPLPPSSPVSTRSNTSVRSTRSAHSIADVSKSLHTAFKKKVNNSLLSNLTATEDITDISNFQAPNRISSTPKQQSDTNIYSPISSPILSPKAQPIKDKSAISFTSVSNNDIFANESLKTSDIEKAPRSTPGRKPRKASSQVPVEPAPSSPECQVPVATVKPSTRKNQSKDSVSSESMSLSMPSISQDVSGRSIDLHLSQKMIDSKRTRSSTDQLSGSLRSTPSSSFEYTRFSSLPRQKRRSLANVQSLNNTTFDFSSVTTPKVPMETFISPIDQAHSSANNIVTHSNTMNVDEESSKYHSKSPKSITSVGIHNGYEGIKNIFQCSPPADYSDVRGVRRLLRTPKPSTHQVFTPSVEGVRNLFQKEHVNNYSDVRGVKRLLKTPKSPAPIENYASVKGIKHLFNRTPVADYTNVSGVKRIFNQKGRSPISNYDDVRGVNKLLKTPQRDSSSYGNVEGIKDLFIQSPLADYTNVSGVSRLYNSTTEQNYMNVKGVRTVFIETKNPNSPDVAGVEILYESPKKVIDEYSHCQPTTSKPIVKVSPMSRNASITKLEVNQRVATVSGDSLLDSNQRKTLTLGSDNDNSPEEPKSNNIRQRKTRKIISNSKPGMEDNSTTEGKKTRGRRNVEPIVQSVEEVPRLGRTLRNRNQATANSPKGLLSEITFGNNVTLDTLETRRRKGKRLTTYETKHNLEENESQHKSLGNETVCANNVDLGGVGQPSKKQPVIVKSQDKPLEGNEDDQTKRKVIKTRGRKAIKPEEDLTKLLNSKETQTLELASIKSPEKLNDEISDVGKRKTTKGKRLRFVDDNLNEMTCNKRRATSNGKKLDIVLSSGDNLQEPSQKINIGKRKSHSILPSESSPNKICTTRQSQNNEAFNTPHTDLDMVNKHVLNSNEGHVSVKLKVTRSRRGQSDNLLEEQNASPEKSNRNGREIKSKSIASNSQKKLNSKVNNLPSQEAENINIEKPETTSGEDISLLKNRRGRPKKVEVRESNQTVNKTSPLKLRSIRSKVKSGERNKHIEEITTKPELTNVNGVPRSPKKGRRTKEIPANELVTVQNVISPVTSRTRRRRGIVSDETESPQILIKTKRTIRSKSSETEETNKKTNAVVTITEDIPEESGILTKKARRSTLGQTHSRTGNKNLKSKVVEKEETERTNNTKKLHERLRADINEPSTSFKEKRSRKSKGHQDQSEKPPAKKVQFNKCETVYSITPSFNRQLRSKSTRATSATPTTTKPPKKVVSTKVSTKRRSAVKRKSSSPVKSPPAKRITRSRK